MKAYKPLVVVAYWLLFVLLSIFYGNIVGEMLTAPNAIENFFGVFLFIVWLFAIYASFRGTKRFFQVPKLETTVEPPAVPSVVASSTASRSSISTVTQPKPKRRNK